jgi:hypothetical protein
MQLISLQVQHIDNECLSFPLSVSTSKMIGKKNPTNFKVFNPWRIIIVYGHQELGILGNGLGFHPMPKIFRFSHNKRCQITC